MHLEKLIFKKIGFWTSHTCPWGLSNSSPQSNTLFVLQILWRTLSQFLNHDSLIITLYIHIERERKRSNENPNYLREQEELHPCTKSHVILHKRKKWDTDDFGCD